MTTKNIRDYIINKGKLYYKGKIFNVDELAQERLLRAKVMMEFILKLKNENKTLDDIKTYIPDNQIPFIDYIWNNEAVIWKSVDGGVKLTLDDINNLLTIAMMNQYYTYLSAMGVDDNAIEYIPPLQEDSIQQQEDNNK